MSRIPLSAALALALLAIFWTSNAEAGALDVNTMKVVLHTATPQEGNFLQRVVDMVDQGALPLDLVQSTFLWAKRKPVKKFYYFKQGLILRAADRGIVIKP